MEKIARMPEGGYGPDFWRGKEEAFEGFKREAMATGCSEERADAHIRQWRAQNDADVQRWSQEYQEFRAEAREMFERRGMIPNDVEKWNALVLWGQKQSQFVGDQLKQTASSDIATLALRRAVAYSDEALQVINETETEVFDHLQKQDSENFRISLNIRYLATLPSKNTQSSD